MTAFTLKIIALITMIIDHVGAVFPQTGYELRVIGRVAFPIYVYLVADGFRYTKSPAKFLTRLLIFAIISQPFFAMALHRENFSDISFIANTNIFYTLFLGGLAITAYNWVRKQSVASQGVLICVAFLPLPALMWLAEVALTTDYGAYGVFFIFMMYLITDKKLRMAAMAVLCVWQHTWVLQGALDHGVQAVPIVVWMLIPATLVSVLLVALYNGKRGPSLKWFFYASYPMHLAILLIF